MWLPKGKFVNSTSTILNVFIDRFVIMPNHVHTIIVIEGLHEYSPQPGAVADSQTIPGKPRAKRLGVVVGGYKAGASRVCKVAGIRDFAWQERFHDRILNSNASVNAVHDYIARNPANWVEDPDRLDECSRSETGQAPSLPQSG